MPYIITELLYFLFLSNGQRHFEEKTMHYPAACYHLKSYFITYLISNVKSSSTFPGSLACSCTGVHQAPRRRLRTVANDAKCRSLDNTVAQQGKAGQWHWHLELPSKKYSKKSKLRSGREGGKMVSWSWEQEVDPNAETGARFWAGLETVQWRLYTGHWTGSGLENQHWAGLAAMSTFHKLFTTVCSWTNWI